MWGPGGCGLVVLGESLGGVVQTQLEPDAHAVDDEQHTAPYARVVAFATSRVASSTQEFVRTFGGEDQTLAVTDERRATRGMSPVEVSATQEVDVGDLLLVDQPLSETPDPLVGPAFLEQRDVEDLHAFGFEQTHGVAFVGCHRASERELEVAVGQSCRASGGHGLRGTHPELPAFRWREMTLVLGELIAHLDPVACTVPQLHGGTVHDRCGDLEFVGLTRVQG